MKMQSSPQVGDILFAHLPEEGCTKQAKLRPVIVLAVTVKDEVDYLTVAKGTSQNIEKCYLGEFVVQNAVDLSACGLSKSTKFQLRRMEILPYNKQWFEGQAGSLPASLQIALVRAAQEIGLI